MNEIHDFSIHVLSNTNNDFYKNSLTTFTNYLPSHHPLKKEKWLCGLGGFGVHLNINHLKIRNDVVGVYYLGSSLLEGIKNLEIVLSTPKLQLKFNYKEHVSKLIEYDFINFFNKIDSSENLSKLITISVQETEKQKEQFVFKNKANSDNFFFFHENLVEALYAKNLVKTNFSPELQNLIEIKNNKVNIKNEKYYVIEVPANTTLFSEAFNSETFNFPALINIKSNITSKHPMNEEFSSIIHTSSIPFKFVNKYFYRHLSNIRYFEITSSDLNSIKIKYENLDGSPLNLLPGSASFVKLHFRPMNYLYKPLTHITLTSKNQLPYNFSTLLKHPIELEDDAAICLTDVSIPNQILNVPSVLTKNAIYYRIYKKYINSNLEENNNSQQEIEDSQPEFEDSEEIPNNLHEYISEIEDPEIESTFPNIEREDLQPETEEIPNNRHENVTEKEDSEINLLFPNIERDFKREVGEHEWRKYFTYGKFLLPKGHFFSAQSFCKEINKNLPLDLINLIEFNVFDNAGKEFIKITQKTETERVTLLFPKIMSELFGFTNSKNYIKEKHFVNVDKSKLVHFFEEPSHIYSFYPNFIMVYCNVVTASICGGRFLPLLKILPVQVSKKDAYLFLDFNKFEYIKTNVGILNEIKIELRTQTGEYVEFEENAKPLVFNFSVKS